MQCKVELCNWNDLELIKLSTCEEYNFCFQIKFHFILSLYLSLQYRSQSVEHPPKVRKHRNFVDSLGISLSIKHTFTKATSLTKAARANHASSRCPMDPDIDKHSRYQ